MRLYKQAPLSFAGQKKSFRDEFIQIIKDKFSEDNLFVDLFGGSGYLSHCIHYVYPKAKVVYNDFDNYAERLQHISETNEIVDCLRDIFQEYRVGKQEKCSPELEDQIYDLLQEFEDSGSYVDYITLSSVICFSNRICKTNKELRGSRLYNRLRNGDFNQADGYLDGLTIVRDDYKKIYEQYKDCDKVVWILDPPYIATETRQYKMDCWVLKDYLDVLLIPKNESRWIYFTCDGSGILELMDWIDRECQTKFLDGVQVKTRRRCCSYQKEYLDYMLVKA